jgi:hypothetical protein
MRKVPKREFDAIVTKLIGTAAFVRRRRRDRAREFRVVSAARFHAGCYYAAGGRLIGDDQAAGR